MGEGEARGPGDGVRARGKEIRSAVYSMAWTAGYVGSFQRREPRMIHRNGARLVEAGELARARN